MPFQVERIHTSLDAFALYCLIEKGTDHIFLDSSDRESQYGRYSMIGANPFLTVKYENGKLYEKRGKEAFRLCPKQEDIFPYLKEKLEQYQVVNPTDLPFVGGAIGYFSYDFGCRCENIPTRLDPAVAVPEVYFVFYDNAVIIDQKTDAVFITGMGILHEAKQSIGALIRRIKEKELQKKGEEMSAEHASFTEKRAIFESPFSSEAYQNAIERMRDYMREGHIYIANMTHTFSGSYEESPQKTYARLRQINPAPFSAYLPLEGFSVLCSSPERFLKVKNAQVQTRPIKGTIQRGRTPEEDRQNKEILAGNEKERAELLMITDLERNDLSKVCIPGTVKVPELFKIETYPTVFHLTSTVEGTLKAENTAVDCLKAAFPGGSITGAPKIRAMEIIDELERKRRGLYTGAIGYFGFDGGADFNIVIRSILIKDGRAYLGVGGGITWESDAQSEYDETILKASALFKALGVEYTM